MKNLKLISRFTLLSLLALLIWNTSYCQMANTPLPNKKKLIKLEINNLNAKMDSILPIAKKDPPIIDPPCDCPEDKKKYFKFEEFEIENKQNPFKKHNHLGKNKVINKIRHYSFLKR